MPKFFIPARSSRHRTACFALYKALVREGRRVPLPDHVAYRPPGDKPYVHPTQHFIRRSFRQNRNDTSPRLVMAALNAGYKFLGLFAEARTPASQAHSSIVAFLEKNKPPIHKSFRSWKQEKKEKRKEQAAKEASNGKPPRLPLLTRRVVPGTEQEIKDAHGHSVTTYQYEYVPTQDPKPLSELRGRRRVPKLATEASGIPFLRLRRKQPRILSNIIQYRRARRAARAGLASELIRTGLDFAAQEDLWEENLARGIAETGDPPLREDGGRGGGSRGNPKTESYRHSVGLGISYLSAQLSVEAVDMLARSKAYLAIVDRERALAEQEDKERLVREQHEQEQKGQGSTSHRPS